MKAIRTVFVFLLCIVGALLTSRSAMALTGTVSGKFQLMNHSGNWCDSALQDCTGSYYPVSDHDVFKPYANAKVEVWQGSTVIGTGVTNDTGNFWVSWTSSSTANAWVRVFATQKDGRFGIHNTAGQRYNNGTSTFTLTSGSNKAIGTWSIGTVAVPYAPASDYYMAEFQYRTSFAYVGALVSSYTGVELRGYTSGDIPGWHDACITSCAFDPKRVLLDADAAFKVQARIMHELGHVASKLLDGHHGNGDGSRCYPSTTGNCGWDVTTAEWGMVAFEEAFASFAADVTLWAPNAVNPTTCRSIWRCGHTTATNRLELTSYPYSTDNCDDAAEEERWMLSASRYLWDVYDDHNDCDGDTVAEGWGFWPMFANVATYPAGTDPGEVDDPWDAAYATIDHFDGRGSSMYANHYLSQYSINTGVLRIDNCNPP